MSEVQEIAKQLDSMEYPVDIPNEIAKHAKALGIVIVYGASDDLMEFEGAIHDEVGAYDGTTVEVSPNGLVPEFDSVDKDNKDALRSYFSNEGKGIKIEAIWGKGGYSFQYETDIPHATFEVMEDGDKYCRGIVFRLSDCSL